MALTSIGLVVLMFMWTFVRTRGFLFQQSYRYRALVPATPTRPRRWTKDDAPSTTSRPKCAISRTTIRLYSSVSKATESYTSWDQEEEDEELEGGVTITNDANEGIETELMEEYHKWTGALQKAMNNLEKKQKSLQSELEKAQSVEETMARAQLLVSNLYLFPTPNVREATVQDWENDGKEVVLKVDPQYESANAEAEALFDRARKLKRGSKVVKELLTETDQAFEMLQDAQLDLTSAYDADTSDIDEGRLRLVQDRLLRSAKQTKFQLPSESNKSSRNKQQRPPASPYSNIRKLKSPGGCTVLVGRNRRGNEYLSFQVARGNDIWMHSRGCPGAHVLIQNRRGSPEPTDACWQFAANLAVFYSDNRSERKGEVTAAEAKHLLKPRGAPLGALKLREELKVLVGRPDDVPESLKLARDESGQTDEYRSSDKAKHRRHTQKVAKETEAKRRAEHKAKRKRRNRSD
jgi:predicted ribosome quality control (RQC) complex YloA/Tae2 family protein